MSIMTGLFCLIFALSIFGIDSSAKAESAYRMNGFQYRPGQKRLGSSIDVLIGKLKAGGLRVKKGGIISQPFFSVSGRIVSVNGEQVQVFIYRTTQMAAADAGRISPEGSPIGTSMITWVAPPHFYRKGRMIVLYIGSNASVMKGLEKVLGKQFAGK